MRRVVMVCCLCLGAVYGQAPNSPVKNAPQSPSQLTQGTQDLSPAGLDKVMQELYACISGPAGLKRDPDRFRNLFVKEMGRLAAVGKNPKTNEFGVRLMTPEEYIEKSFPYLEKNGFFENEVARRTERFGDIVQVWSTYESRRALGEQPFQRGINGLQLVDNGTGWKILSIFWEGERPDNPIPEQYLKK